MWVLRVSAAVVLLATLATAQTEDTNYVYINEYGADNRNNDFCDVRAPLPCTPTADHVQCRVQ